MSDKHVSESDFKARVGQTWNGGWPLERYLFLLAGAMVLISVALAVAVSEWFLLLGAFVGINELIYASLGFCGASLLLTRFTSARPAGASAVKR